MPKLVFNLKKEWFEKIKSGEKTHEYREYKQYWINRLEYDAGGYRFFNGWDCQNKKEKGLKVGDIILLASGYPAKNEQHRFLKAKVKSIKIVNGLNTDLKVNKDVYDIEFELINKGG